MGPGPGPRPRLRVLALGLVLVTAMAVLVDLARPGLGDPARRAVAGVSAPAQSFLAGWDSGRVTALTAERNELAARVALLEEQLRRAEQLEALQRATSWGDHVLIPARVVGFAPGASPVGGRTVTLDVGSADGISTDLTVVSVDGLVGRVLRVAPRSADVLLLGDPGVVVGVRYGARGALGQVGGTGQPALPTRGHHELTLTALGDEAPQVGDQVTTLGSPDNRPYVARVPLGTVTALDPDRGQLGRTAVVTPHVDTDILDLVAVVLTGEPGR
jgi:rod shape-determining protein MreC